MKKRVLTLLLAVVMMTGASLAFSACGKKPDAADNRAELKVGLECAYAPFNWTQLDSSNGAVPIDGSSQYANGYDVKMAKLIADALDMKLVIVKLEWDGLIPAVQSGAIDMVIAGMSPTDERRESIEFTDAYYTSNLVVVVRKDGSYADAKTLADLSGAKIVGQLGTFHETVIEQIPNVLKQTSMKDFSTMIVALKSKGIDGYIAEKPGAIANCNANSDFVYIPLENNGSGFTIENLDNVTIAVGLKKGSDLKDKINSILSGITEDMRNNMMDNAISHQPSED